MASSQKELSDRSNSKLKKNDSSSLIFPGIDALIASFKKEDFLNLTIRKRFRLINQTLCQLIKNTPAPAFLLCQVLDYIDRINKENYLTEPLNFAKFEFWLNHFSELSEQENYAIRAKIVGKNIPREDYQAFFPIGMGKIFSGTHFIAAHLSPDIDTMIASFWGWVDAFGARIGTGLHLWCLPGGPPDSPVTSVFQNLFGPGLFPYLARTTPTLTLSAMDLLTQKQLSKELGQTLISTINHGSNDKAVILVDELGHYLGDWRSSDVEQVRQIIILFKSCLHWFENNLHSKLISLFAKENLSIKDLPAFNASLFDTRIKDCQPAQDFIKQQQQDLNDFFSKVLGVKQGLEGTFRDLIQALDSLSLSGMLSFQKEIEALPSSGIFDSSGILSESRPKIFNHLQTLIKMLAGSIFTVRNFVERLDVVLKIKYTVLKLPQVYINLQSDVDEMRQKMQNYDFLTVVINEKGGSLFPVGIVRENDLRENGLGTVSLRDFCNLEEVRMASYLDVISVVDHHKTSIKTLSVPTALIGDAQSCNVLIAEQTFSINDKYSLGGMNLQQIDAEINEISSHLKTQSQMRILQRLLKRRMNVFLNHSHWIHPEREYKEYVSFLHAILDDTDLLTKVSNRDLECVAQLLNRLKSLSIGSEVEIIDFDDLPRDKKFTKAAAQRILKQEDMYALYKEIYRFRENAVEENLDLCLKGQPSNIFLDTKEQNGCARVGQTKIFSSNFPYYLQHAQDIRQIWLNESLEANREKPEFDLHLHMISTIASADEVYQNQIGPYSHQDELWIWIPGTMQGHHHLNSFLTGFQNSLKDFYDQLSLEFLGSPSEEFLAIFKRNFPNVPKKDGSQPSSGPMVILRFKPGVLNSRKAMVSPYLPRLIT